MIWQRLSEFCNDTQLIHLTSESIQHSSEACRPEIGPSNSSASQIDTSGLFEGEVAIVQGAVGVQHAQQGFEPYSLRCQSAEELVRAHLPRPVERLFDQDE